MADLLIVDESPYMIKTYHLCAGEFGIDALCYDDGNNALAYLAQSSREEIPKICLFEVLPE